MHIESATAQPVLNLFLFPRAAEVRTANDLYPVALLAAEQISPQIERGTVARPERTSTQIRMSSWLVDTMQIIEAGRQSAKIDKQGEALSTVNSVFDTAEMAAALLSSIEPSKRPQLNIGEDCTPSFATAVRDFYIHLTIDGPERITWFAETGGKEYFRENVPFDGRRLPEDLRVLLSV